MSTNLTNEEQSTTGKNVPEVDAANDDHRPGNQGNALENEARKQEDKTIEDHGGEELVEGQEDDVIY